MQRLSWSWRYWPLAVKIIIPMLAFVAMIIGAITAVTIQREQQDFELQLQQEANLLISSLDITIGDAIYRLDINFLEETMEELGTIEVIQDGRIFDSDGRVIASTLASPVVEFGDERNTFGQQLINGNDEIVYLWQDDRLIAGRPILADRTVIGAISVELSTREIDVQMAEVRRRTIQIALISIVVAFIVAYLLSRFIVTPLHQMTEATQRIANGDLNQRVSVNTGDELATLATSFNIMTERLRKTVFDLKESEREAQQARDEAIEASYLKSEFLATMSHELRTPLNSIIGFSEIIQSGLTGDITDKTADRVERITRNSKQLLALINDILDLSKIEARKVKIASAPFTPTALVADIRMTMQEQAEEKQIKLQTHVDSELPRVLQGDVQRLRQILLNLVSNAIKFTHEGGVSIEFKRAGSTRWQIIVADTGIGIEDDIQKFIFDKFRQGDGSSKRSYGGTGLGLAIVKELSVLMGGDVVVDSHIGQGSAFTVTLPLIEYQPEYSTEVVAK